MALIPPHPWVHAVVAIIGTLVCLYSFLGRLWKGTFLTSEVMAATAVGVIIGPAAARIIDPQAHLSRHSLYGIIEAVSFSSNGKRKMSLWQDCDRRDVQLSASLRINKPLLTSELRTQKAAQLVWERAAP